MRAVFIYGASSADLANISLAFEAHNHHIGIIPCAMAGDRTLMRSFGLEGPVPNILADKNSFRAVRLISYLWKSGGFGTIVYLAAIAGIELIRNFVKRPRLTDPTVGSSCGTLRFRR